MISDPEQLARLVPDLTAESSLSVDLEADSLHHYREKVCLMQVSTPRGDLLLDTLRLPDLEPLRALFANPGVRKIFHAGDNDLRNLWRDFRLEVRGLFDTLIAAQLLGEEKVGLADLLAKYCGLTLDKRFQKADWSLRPLPPEMVVYAAEDTRHLERLATLFEAALRAKGRMEWAIEEFKLMEKVRPSEPVPAPLFTRVKGGDRLDRRALAVLEELARWRESAAEQRDVPPFRVLANAALVELARLTPATLPELLAVREVPQRVAERSGRELLAAIARGRALPADRLPAWPRRERSERDPAVEKRIERLKTWRTRTALSLALAPGILINNALLEELAKAPPRTVEDLERFPTMKSWQRRELGAQLVAVLASGDAAPAISA